MLLLYKNQTYVIYFSICRFLSGGYKVGGISHGTLLLKKDFYLFRSLGDNRRKIADSHSISVLLLNGEYFENSVLTQIHPIRNGIDLKREKNFDRSLLISVFYFYLFIFILFFHFLFYF